MLNRWCVYGVDQLSKTVGQAFAWCIVILTIGTCYEVFMPYLLNNPTSWAFDMSYTMYGAMFFMAGAYTLSRGGHVRADMFYRLWRPRTQAMVERVLYILFFFPGIVLLKNGITGYNQDALDTVYAEYDVPSDAFPDFDEHDFQNRLDLTKGFMIQMQYHDAAITRHVSGFADFYSLWAVIALNLGRMPDPQTTSSRYAAVHEKGNSVGKDKGYEPSARL